MRCASARPPSPGDIDCTGSSLLDGRRKWEVVDTTPARRTKMMDHAERLHYRMPRNHGIDPAEELTRAHRNVSPEPHASS
jgi:hypothetical protein